MVAQPPGGGDQPFRCTNRASFGLWLAKNHRKMEIVDNMLDCDAYESDTRINRSITSAVGKAIQAEIIWTRYVSEGSVSF
jgi:hypothetical protein